MPPNTSDSRHSTWIALACGCRFCSAIFSGRMCTSQKTTMPTIGTTISTTHAMPFATVSSVSPANIEAHAGVDASASAAASRTPGAARVRA